MMKLGAVLIVRDEGPRIAACLRALSSSMDEIMVADTGSLDDTRAIAQTFATNVVSIPWQDDFATARNAAISYCTADWLLSIDGDEVIQDPETTRERLLRFIARYDDCTLGTIAIESPMGADVDAMSACVPVPRVFRRGAYRFEGAVHEQLRPVSGAFLTAPTGIRVLHSGYGGEESAARTKAERNAALLNRALKRDPNSAYFHYQLGKTWFSIQDHARAEPSLATAARLMVEIAQRTHPKDSSAYSPLVVTDCFTSLSYAMANQDRHGAAAELLDSVAGLPSLSLYADLPYAQGYLRLMGAELDPSQLHFIDALDRGPNREIVVGTGSFLAHFHLGLIAEARDEFPQAAVHYAAALQARPAHGPTLNRILDWPIEHGLDIPPQCHRAADAGRLAGFAHDKLAQAGSVELREVLRRALAKLSPPIVDRRGQSRIPPRG